MCTGRGRGDWPAAYERGECDTNQSFGQSIHLSRSVVVPTVVRELWGPECCELPCCELGPCTAQATCLLYKIAFP